MATSYHCYSRSRYNCLAKEEYFLPMVSSINIVQNIVNIKFNWHHGLHCCFGTSILIIIIITVNNMAYKVSPVHVHLFVDNISNDLCVLP